MTDFTALLTDDSLLADDTYWGPLFAIGREFDCKTTAFAVQTVLSIGTDFYKRFTLLTEGLLVMQTHRSDDDDDDDDDD
jgi:hypothetical protein